MNANNFSLRHLDVHTHTHFPAYDGDREDVMSRAREQGIGMIQIGSNIKTSKEAVLLAEQYNDGVWACVGLHPIHTHETFHDEHEGVEEPEEFDIEQLKDLSTSKKVVGIGECGLDYFHIKKEEDKMIQKKVFKDHIKLAHELKKPLMIHCREAYTDLIQIIKEEKEFLNECPGVIHFFCGTTEEAKDLLELGFYFTFGGAITYPKRKNGTDYEEVIRLIPIERLFSETDAPYVAPVPHRGKRNEPLFVLEVEKKIAEIKDVSPEIVSRIIIENAQKVFGI
jgi:TatD DNase family protein